ncbi:MAG TPA: hypothetical protein VIY49_20525 [Bryobacteraceae bacterium]
MLIGQWTRAGAPTIVGAGFRRDDSSSLRKSARERRDATCSLRDLASGSEAVVVFEGHLIDEVEEFLPALWNEVDRGATAFTVLVPRRTPPQLDSDYAEPVSSFFCSSNVFARFLALGIDCWATTLCFAVLRAIASGDIEVDRLLVRQIPAAPQRLESREIPAQALIMPHRGDPAHLRVALKYIDKAAGNSPTVRVGLDQDEHCDHATLSREFPRVEFFRFSPAPVGPYVIRQDLAERSAEPLLTLQDADDLSCYDRFVTLAHGLAETGCDIIGSHELCLDELRCLVQPVRFPLDCTDSLDLCANHALLHATLMAHRRAFFHVGGLSTDQIIANDTQFLLRAHFNSTIRNVDEFLYVRRRHASSLTNAPDTVFDSPLRRRLASEWARDFDAVRRGTLQIHESSLRPMRRTQPWRVDRLGVFSGD